MSVPAHPLSVAVLQQLHTAMNQHDLAAFLDCFDPDYQSEQPAHPDRAFRGKAQVQKNWSNIFSAIPDFHSELLRFAAGEDMVWSEWHWHGTRADRTTLNMRGVTLFGIRDNRIIWGRLYMESVDEQGADIDASVTHMSGKQQ
jgi:ketosteroid isomerase-like protein